MKPLAIDLFCGLGGWTEGLLAEGYRVIGYDIERHEYGDMKYPAELVIQDVLTLHGAQFKDAALIVASPPCQEFSYMAMPWSKAKQKIRDLEEGRDDPKRLTALFDACFRIQREASEAAGHHIPMVVENVRGAQRWVGRARWHFGSFYLWGDVPALMPIVKPRAKVGGIDFNGYGTPGYKGQAFNTTAEQRLRECAKNPGFRFDGSGRSFQSESVDRHTKNNGGSWFNIGSPGQKVTNQNPVHALAVMKTSGLLQQRNGHGHTRHLTNQAEDEGVKQCGSGREWFAGEGKISRTTSSGSHARKAASAMIAKIPLVLSTHIARVYYPQPGEKAAV